MSIGEKLQSLPKWILFLCLIVTASVLQFFNIPLPNKPQDPAIDYYAFAMSIPPGSTVLVSSDWTNSTHGESGPQFDALMRILMRRNIKFAVYTTADGQAPQVAKDEIRRLNEQRVKDGERPYRPFEDYVMVGYFPSAEGENLAMSINLRSAFAGKKDFPEGAKEPVDIWQSPVLKDIKDISDVKALFLISASNTDQIIIERLAAKVPLVYAVTGISAPQNFNYYSSGQLKGLVGGLKGIYDLEYLMTSGVNHPGADGKIAVASTRVPGDVPPLPGRNQGLGTAYFPTLHAALALMILAIIIGNVGMFMARKAQGASK
ncbi:MAG: hypothetical protein JSS72_08460 [Armatimonadetes bacterium]|nr:hypothetical protein [Armatimonadota bacterium]